MKFMENNEETVKIGWYLPKKAKDDFVSFCSDNGLVIQQNCAGALTIWKYLPPQIREVAIQEAKGKGAVDKKFWESYRKGLEAAIRDRLSNQPDKQKG